MAKKDIKTNEGTATLESEKDFIDKAITNGVSYEKLADLLKKKGIETTVLQLQMYAKGMLEFETITRNESEEIEDFEPIDVNAILNQFGGVGMDNFSIAHKLIAKMFIGQSVKTYSLHEKYLEGEINKFPENDLKNLKLLQDIIISIEKYRGSNNLLSMQVITRNV